MLHVAKSQTTSRVRDSQSVCSSNLFRVILRVAKSLLHAHIIFFKWMVDVALCDITDN